MELTPEQNEIINSSGDIKINAVAGSGKTTTIIKYATALPADSSILYLAFNKSVKQEAISEFNREGLLNVTVETAHSLAFHHIVKGSLYKVCQGYKTHEIADLLKLQEQEGKHTRYVLANHINKFVSYFCNSDKHKVQELNYVDLVSDNKARAFVQKHYQYIETHTRQLLAMMDRGEVDIIHDFYLKKFQLSSPQIIYDYILFDEGQDASPAMLDIFLRQSATKVIVGDTHQQIYGWRHAVNSLERTDFQSFSLSTSFRFGPDLANLAIEVLKWKKYIGKEISLNIVGKGGVSQDKSKAVIARTNLGLLLKAIQYITNKKTKNSKIYFEGNIHSYTYADDGASLYDVLNLYNYKFNQIRDKLIREMKSINELQEYVEKTEDVEMGMMIKIVQEYGNKIPNILNTLKERHVDNREQADIIFSTVHKSKGMEYGSVFLAEDFITEEKLGRISGEAKLDDNQRTKLNEEINLLYVAVTRAREDIAIPESMLPTGLPESKHIRVYNSSKKQSNESEKPMKNKPTNNYSSSPKIDETRRRHQSAYQPWTPEHDNELSLEYEQGTSIKKLAKRFGRTEGAIRTRLKKLQLGRSKLLKK